MLYMKYHLFKKYKVTTTKDSFYTLLDEIKKCDVYDLEIIGNDVTFYSNNKIKNDCLCYENLFLKLLKKQIFPNILLLLTFCIVFVVIIATPYDIREVKYQNGSAVDDEIFNLVQQNCQKIDNYNDYSRSLMIKYPHYSWISIKKQGSVIYLNIEIDEIKQDNNLIKNFHGDLISGYDAYVKSIIVYKGKPLIDINRVVKVGDTLVTGIVGNVEVGSDAIVIGEVNYIRNIKVPLKKTLNSFNGNVYKYTNFEINNYKMKNIVSPFKNFKFKSTVLFNIGNAIKLTNNYFYETETFEIRYNEDDAIRFAKSMVYYELEKLRTSDAEKIYDVEVLSIDIKNDQYLMKLLVKADKNIVVFKEYQK